MTGRSWSFKHERRVIELAKASKSLEEAAKIMKCSTQRIRKVSMRLGAKFNSDAKNPEGVSGLGVSEIR
jgi:hypothetical protein